MSQKPTLLVAGATGAQGGSVARHALASGRWRVRALTRRPDAPAARALAAAGAEPVRGDLTDPTGLRAACLGADALFLVTDYWTLGGEGEYRAGRTAVDVALDAGVRHLVYSGGPETTRASGGQLPVPQYTAKARLEAELRAERAPATFVHLATYYENWPQRRLRRDGDGGLSFALPYGEVPLPAVAVDDVGGVVLALLDAGPPPAGRADDPVGVVGDSQPGHRYAEILTAALRRPVRYRPVSRDEFAAAPSPAAPALANMFEFSRRHLGDRRADLVRSRELFPKIRTFEQWVRGNLAAFGEYLSTEESSCG